MKLLFEFGLIFLTGLSRFSGNQIFIHLVFLSNFMRDVVPMGFEIVLHMILFYLLKSYNQRKVRITGQTEESTFAVSMAKVERNNLNASFVICILSILMHSVMYLVNLYAFICPFCCCWVT